MNATQEELKIMQSSKFYNITTILLAGFLFRIFLLKYHWVVGFDEVHYLRLGLSAAQNGFSELLHPYWPPTYPILIALFSNFFSDGELAARLVNIVSSLVSVFLIYALAKKAFSEKIALLAALTFTFFPPLAFDATNVLAETVYTTFGLASILSGWIALNKRSFMHAILVGVFSAFAYLAKPEGIYYVMVFAGISAIVFLIRIKQMQKNLLAITALSLVGFLIFSLPYLLYVKSEMGMWSLSMKFQVNQQFAALAYAKDKSPEARFSLTEDNRYLPTDVAYHDGNFQVLVDQSTSGGQEKKVDIGLGLFIKKYVENFFKVNREGIPVVLTFAPFLLVALGLFGREWNTEQTRFNVYILMFVLFWWLVAMPMFHVNLRYFTPQLPLLFIWLANGLYILKEVVSNSIKNNDKYVPDWMLGKSQFVAGTLVAILLLGFSYIPEMGKILKRNKHDNDYWAEAVELKTAGEWLKANTNGPFRIMSENKAVDYYAGILDTRNTVSFPINKNFNRILAYAQFKDVDYLVVTDRYKSKFTNLQFLTDKQVPYNELKLVYENKNPAGIKTVIYKLIP
ncbi:MAG: hypothetical protein DWQ05_19795 [Calditrichaeota bacterium]|nr:MAG: hypothetical protein DWQ05_19795 [Calditrichota bacterium]